MKKPKDYKAEAKRLRADLKWTKSQVDALRKERAELLDDRAKFRSYIAGKFKWFIELNAENKTPCMKWLIEDMSRLFNRVEKWDW